MSSLRGIEPDEASWRPGRDRHNVWELAVHCAYWKYRVAALLADLPRGSFDLKGSNFFARPKERSAEAWTGDLVLLRSWQDRLLETVDGFDPGRLSDRVGNGRFSFEELIDGAAAHDIYHAGQIQLLKKLRSSSA